MFDLETLVARNEAYHEGCNARREGLSKKRNPWPTQDVRHTAWKNGWSDTDAKLM